MICTKKAGAARLPATTKSNHCEAYRQPRPASRPLFRFRAQRDDSIAALGGLLIYLLSRPLPSAERCFGWALAERWLSEAVSPGSGVTT